ncbi:unnamed protein product [Brassica oleracea var. botrytis]|uniref:Uncharacterized protein n=2 Tax=Brassica TaxID=3705 RepID=A0A3P6EDC4_BRAOL|nr:unnamed protein product [Brassica napus]CDY69142.1 BnaCnng62070D [Brassica napus]VDD37698.1 unnamed protein product [Brassica oleracea]
MTLQSCPARSDKATARSDEAAARSDEAAARSDEAAARSNEATAKSDEAMAKSDYFAKALSGVSLPWVKMFNESPNLSTLIDVPLSYIPLIPLLYPQELREGEAIYPLLKDVASSFTRYARRKQRGETDVHFCLEIS